MGDIPSLSNAWCLLISSYFPVLNSINLYLSFIGVLVPINVFRYGVLREITVARNLEEKLGGRRITAMMWKFENIISELNVVDTELVNAKFTQFNLGVLIEVLD